MRTPINLLEISIPVGPDFMKTDQHNAALVQQTLEQAGLPPHAMVVEGVAALALNGLRPWHPTEKGQPGPVQVTAAQGLANRLFQQQHPVRGILGLPKKFRTGDEPHVLVVKPQSEPQSVAMPAGSESLFDFYVQQMAKPGENGWQVLDPAKAAQMLLRDDPRPETIVRVLRTHLDAHMSQQPIASDTHWQYAVSKAAKMAYTHKDMRRLPGVSLTRLLLNTGLHHHEAFSFVPIPVGTDKRGNMSFRERHE